MEIFNLPIVLKTTDCSKARAELQEEQCLILLPKEMIRRKKQTVKTIDQLYWRLLGKIALPDLTGRINLLNKAYFGFDYNRVRFHRQFKRWGSCSSLKNINLSHRLIGAPQTLVDYVLIHELAHLKYLNHSADFWNLVKTTGQKPREARLKLMEYGRLWQKEYQKWLQSLKL